MLHYLSPVEQVLRGQPSYAACDCKWVVLLRALSGLPVPSNQCNESQSNLDFGQPEQECNVKQCK